ncbi:MAG: hypothetical protein WDW38_004365 [Sanguina aurantia]
MPTTSERLPVALASRAWRPGIRTHITLDSKPAVAKRQSMSDSMANLESYSHWNDTLASGGHQRAAASPFLAHARHQGTYKWLLYGDDDTIFYMDGVRKLLSRFDPSLPLAITDNLWYTAKHPTYEAPRCLPCDFDLSKITAWAEKLPGYVPSPGCPFCVKAIACRWIQNGSRCSSSGGSSRSSGSRSLQDSVIGSRSTKDATRAAALASWASYIGLIDGNATASPWTDHVMRSWRHQAFRIKYGTDPHVPLPKPVLEHSAGSPTGRYVPFPPFRIVDEREPGLITYDNFTRLLPPLCSRHEPTLHAAPHPRCPLAAVGHGGSGIILSAALMELLTSEAALRFISNARPCGGGDCLLSRLLWHFGIGFTDPGEALVHGDFEYEHYSQFVDGNGQRGLSVILANAEAAVTGQMMPKGPRVPFVCDGKCHWLLNNVVAAHIRFRQFASVEKTVAAVVSHVRTYHAAHAFCKGPNSQQCAQA